MSNRPWIAPRYASHFLWSRPALPWYIADKVSMVLKQSEVRSIGISGSLHPSIFISAAYGNPDLSINAFAYTSCWEDAFHWNYVIEDSPGMEETHPYSDICLPIPKNQLRFWDGASPFFKSDSLFVDLPFHHDMMQLKLSNLGNHYKLLMLGFIDTFAGPEDVYGWALNNGYQFRETTATLKNAESGETINYKLCIGKP